MAIKEIEKLKELDFSKQLCFAYLACVRVFPNYSFFVKDFKFGNVTILENSIGFLKSKILVPEASPQEIQSHMSLVFHNTPSTNQFNSFYTTIAMYCGGVVYESINLLNRHNVNRILSDISTLVLDAVDCFIQERDDMDYDDPLFEEKIESDIIMQGEVKTQRDIIAYLARITNLDLWDIDFLLNAQKNQLKLIR